MSQALRRLLVSALLLLGSAVLHAEDGGAALKAGARLRAALPAPTPAVSFSYQGDLLVGDLWAGEVTLSARIARLGRDWVWRLSESSFMDWSSGEVRETLVLHADRELSILSGTYERSDREGSASLGFSRGASGLDVQRRLQKDGAWQEPQRVAMKVPAKALATLPAAMLLLRGVKPEASAPLALPWVGTSAFKDPAASAGDGVLRLTPQGPGHLEQGGKRFETSVVRMEPGGTAWDLHLARDHRTLIGMVSRTGPVRIVPRGLGGERITADPEKPATTWKRAFLKFGFGYHMAREELLAEAFHWQAMYEYETRELKRWPAEKPLAEFKKAWIAEFVAGSQRRDVVATRRLLSMTLATGTLLEESDERVVFQAHPNFGGGTQRTYHLVRKDGVWGITRIDF